MSIEFISPLLNDSGEIQFDVDSRISTRTQDVTLPPTDPIHFDCGSQSHPVSPIPSPFPFNPCTRQFVISHLSYHESLVSIETANSNGNGSGTDSNRNFSPLDMNLLPNLNHQTVSLFRGYRLIDLLQHFNFPTSDAFKKESSELKLELVASSWTGNSLIVPFESNVFNPFNPPLIADTRGLKPIYSKSTLPNSVPIANLPSSSFFCLILPGYSGHPNGESQILHYLKRLEIRCRTSDESTRQNFNKLDSIGTKHPEDGKSKIVVPIDTDLSVRLPNPSPSSNPNSHPINSRPPPYQVNFGPDERDKNTADHWIPRDPSLIRLTGIHPFNAEAPTNMLVKPDSFITPAPLHYVRNHGAVPKLDWNTHQLHVEYPTHNQNNNLKMNSKLSLAMNALLCVCPSVEVSMTMACAGNRRKEQVLVRKGVGFKWGAGAVSTAIWTGLPLSKFILTLAPHLSSPEYSHLHVCFLGADSLPNSECGYGTSLPLDFVLNTNNDVLIAYGMNGHELPPDHGYPVRLVVPNYIGGRSVKWLKSIQITESESNNFYHWFDNRLLPPQVLDPEQAKQGGWWTSIPQTLINHLNINSAIVYPTHGEKLDPNQKFLDFTGYAYSGSGNGISRVELTYDEGETWNLASIHYANTPHLQTQNGNNGISPSSVSACRPQSIRQYCWVWWTISLPTDQLVQLPSQPLQIAVRAWDHGNTQPEILNWNLTGMLNNCWYRIQLTPLQTDRNELVWEHPTQPGEISGGWMDKKLPKSALNSQRTNFENHFEMGGKMENQNGKIITPDATGTTIETMAVKSSDNCNSNAVVPKDTINSIPVDSVLNECGVYSESDVACHADGNSCWIIIDSCVYDVTSYLSRHPGGRDAILGHAGTDATSAFLEIHSKSALRVAQKFKIGRIQHSKSSPADSPSKVKISSASEEAEADVKNPFKQLQMRLDFGSGAATKQTSIRSFLAFSFAVVLSNWAYQFLS